MHIVIPDIKEVISGIEKLNAVYGFGGSSGVITIEEYINYHHNCVDNNLKLITCNTEINNINILNKLLRDYLVRAMRGERGTDVYNALCNNIKTYKDLNSDTYKKILIDSNYRFKDAGLYVIENIVTFFKDELSWNWSGYVEDAELNSYNNFLNDHILQIKYISYKLRDLALSNFSLKYAAFDIHVARIPTRIGLLNYGYSLLSDDSIEMGNNPANENHYLFLHKLFKKLCDLSEDKKYQMADFDKLFWHFGKTVCKDVPNCSICPIKKICLTGQNR
jgi:hypothetical protein